MMMSKQCLTQWSLAAAIVGIGATASVQAAPIVYEGFDYTDGQAIHGQTGGTGFGANAWTRKWGSEEINASAPGMTYGDLDTTGGQANVDVLMIPNGSSGFPRFELQRTIDTSSVDPGLLEAGKFGKTGTSIWGSVIVKNSGTGPPDSLQWLGLHLGDMDLGDMGGSANLNWGLHLNGTTMLSDVSVATEALLVYRIDFNVGADDVFLWVNPDLNTFDPLTTAADIEATDLTLLDRPDISFDEIVVTGGTHSQGVGGAGDTFTRSDDEPYAFIDEIRLGATAADVLPIPEPASAGLICLGGMLIFSSRHGR